MRKVWNPVSAYLLLLACLWGAVAWLVPASADAQAITPTGFRGYSWQQYYRTGGECDAGAYQAGACKPSAPCRAGNCTESLVGLSLTAGFPLTGLTSCRETVYAGNVTLSDAGLNPLLLNGGQLRVGGLSAAFNQWVDVPSLAQTVPSGGSYWRSPDFTVGVPFERVYVYPSALLQLYMDAGTIGTDGGVDIALDCSKAIIR